MLSASSRNHNEFEKVKVVTNSAEALDLLRFEEEKTKEIETTEDGWKFGGNAIDTDDAGVKSLARVWEQVKQVSYRNDEGANVEAVSTDTHQHITEEDQQSKNND